MTSFLSWPIKATKALAHLFRDSQDVQLYVEDTARTSENFYRTLLTRLCEPDVTISRVIGLGGKSNVLDAYHQHDWRNNPNALYIVDGDFDWLRKHGSRPKRGLFVLPMYCIENALICESAALQLLIEKDPSLNLARASHKLSFSDWLEGLKPFVELYSVFAAVAELSTNSEPTVSLGFGPFVQQAKGQPPKCDTAKVNARCTELLTRYSSPPERKQLHLAKRRIARRIAKLHRPDHIVSGKHVMLPMLKDHLARVAKEQYEIQSLRFRLSKHIQLDHLAPLRRAIIEAASR